MIAKFYIFLFLFAALVTLEVRSGCPEPRSCPKNEILNPKSGHGQCVSNSSTISFSESECDRWGECGFCMSNNPYFKSASWCESCLSKSIVRTDEPESGCYPPRCDVYKAVCGVAPELLESAGVCKTLCGCLEQKLTEVKVKTKKITSDQCGLVSFTNPNYRIVGGIETYHGSYPWMVSVVYGISEKPSHRCGGAIVNRRMIITAAHCIVGNLTLYSGYIGKHRKYETDDTEKRIYFSDIIVHPKYYRRTMENDIAILIVNETIEYTNYIRPVCLCSKLPKDREEITVTGWGSTRSRKISSNVLREVTIPMITPRRCNSTIYKTKKRIKTGMFCAGLEMGGKDACQGDSGGPAVWIPDKVYELAGVVSWGYGCAGYRSPGVYTDVCYHRKWIHEHAKKVGIEY